MEIEELATIAVDCGFNLHRDLGPGLLESVYEILMAEALRARGLSAVRQVPVPISYKGVVVDNALKIDLFVEDKLVTNSNRPSATALLIPNSCSPICG